MLERSDLSGPILTPGFSSYLTGYPVPDEGLYVLGRTWEATEIDRPGTVWTHSLLVAFQDLAAISDLSRLHGLFKRPGGDVSSESYKTPLTLMHADVFEFHSSRVGSTKLCSEILRRLYERPNAPARLVAASSDALEGLVLAIWFQQWPKLRRAFQFCTGVLTA